MKDGKRIGRMLLLAVAAGALLSTTFKETVTWWRCSKCYALELRVERTWFGFPIQRKGEKWNDIDDGICDHTFVVSSTSTARGFGILISTACRDPRSILTKQ